ncbi:hypothetical protein HRbin19_01156 [bacterium HR19]|nr:hypothetical protein HRbin19_01156 [bacterium HR19]
MRKESHITQRNFTGKVLLLITTLTLIPVLLFLVSKCGTKTESEIKDEELAKAPGLEESINQIPKPKSITIKKLEEKDIENLKPSTPEEGAAFKAKPGDILVETDKIRVIIQQPSREIGVSTYGGNIIDADIKREDGTFRDIVGEENWFWFLGHTLKPEKVGKWKENIIAATGKLDLLDYINANGLAETVFKSYIPNFELPFKVDEERPIKATKYFVFSDGNHVKIIDVACNEGKEEIPFFFFADIIDSGGDVEFFIPSSELKGYGYKSPLPTGLSVFKTDFIAFVSEKLDSSYGIFPETENNVSLIVSGVAAIAYGMLEGDGLNSLLAIARGTSSKFITLKPSECLKNEKYFIIGNGSASSLTDEFFRIKSRKENSEVYQVKGKVSISGLQVLPSKPHIAVFDKQNKLITTAGGDIYGNFKLVLPAGEYKFVAEIKEMPPSEPKLISVPSVQDVELQIGKPSKIIISAVEKKISGEEINIPAKVSFICQGECPKKICIKGCEILSTSFRDYVYDPLPDGVQEVVFLKDLKPEEIYISPGSYKIVVSRGMEYSRYETDVNIGPGEETRIKAYLHKVANADGWLSADTHVHAVNSPDSPVSLIDRVITFAGEGVDVIISTDHDWLTDYEPAIALLGLKDFLSSLVGQEITTFSYGHFNAYPLKLDKKAPSDGALDWAEKYDRYQKYGIKESEKEKFRFLRSLHPKEIFKNAHLMKPENFQRNIVQVNHPRSGGMGYFDYVLLDTLRLTTAIDPCIHRIFPPAGTCGGADKVGGDTGLFIPLQTLKDMANLERFDAIEVYNSYYEIPIVINDWFTFLNHGVHITGVGVSDTHQKIQVHPGIGRTFVWVGKGNDSPSKFREDIAVKNTFINNLADGKVFISNGIILEEFKLCGARGNAEECAEMGWSNMKNLTSNFKLKIRVKSADWVKFDTLKIFINTRETAARSKQPVKKWPTPSYATSITPIRQEIEIQGNRFGWMVFETEIPLTPPAEDFWVVAVVSCENSCEPNPMFPVVVDKKVKPILITNPIYIDQNGDGRFTPSPPTYAKESPQAPHYENHQAEGKAINSKSKGRKSDSNNEERKMLLEKIIKSLHIH